MQLVGIPAVLYVYLIEFPDRLQFGFFLMIISGVKDAIVIAIALRNC